MWTLLIFSPDFCSMSATLPTPDNPGYLPLLRPLFLLQPLVPRYEGSLAPVQQLQLTSQWFSWLVLPESVSLLSMRTSNSEEPRIVGTRSTQPLGRLLRVMVCGVIPASTFWFLDPPHPVFFLLMIQCPIEIFESAWYCILRKALYLQVLPSNYKARQLCHQLAMLHQISSFLVQCV